MNVLYEYRSVIFTTHKNFSDWGEFSHRDNMAIPIIDRIIHHSDVFMPGGEGYRLKQKLPQRFRSRTMSPPRPNGSPIMSTTRIDFGQLSIHYLIDGSQYAGMGIFELTVGPETRDLTPGQTMHTPKGVVHGFWNPFGGAARALIIMSPDIGAQYFKDVAAVVVAGGPPAKAALMAVMERYGLVPSTHVEK